MKLKSKILSVPIFIFFAACIPPTAPVRKPTASIEPTPTQASLSEVKKMTEWTSHTLIYQPHSEGDAEKLLSVLESNPDLRMSLLFPSHYFDTPERKSTLNRFRVLLSSKQIDIGLTLENEPNLPLIGHLSLAGEKVSRWDFSFSWPEDAAFQVARGSSRYQKRWGDLPSGFLPPHLALSDETVGLLKRFRLNWVVGKNSTNWGIKFFGGLALLVANELPETLTSPKDTAEWVYDQPFAFIDASLWPDPNMENQFLKDVARIQKQKGTLFATASEFVTSIDEEFRLPKESQPFTNDFSLWVSNPLQKKAWQALSEARVVIEKYKNSGRANLQRLDAAFEEMATAESGEFMLAFGENQASSTSSERTFLATLSNIYRLCNVPVPTYLGSSFSTRTIQKATSKPTENDRPFFVEGGQSLTWNDPANDDNGDGQYTYPTGRYPKGAFDLRELTVSWTDSDVTFSGTVVAMPPLSTSVVLPAIDIYIDINRYAGAGNTGPLKKRGAALIDKDAAWEYAVTLSPLIGVLYQAVPAGSPRLLSSEKTDYHNNTFSVTLPRSLVRGDPRQWRLTVGLIGSENNRKSDEVIPVSAQSASSERSFGGATAGRSAPPFIDVLIASSDDQKTILSEYKSGGKSVLPFVEAQ